MKNPSPKNVYHPIIQIGLVGAIASVLNLALTSPTQATEIVPTIVPATANTPTALAARHPVVSAKTKNTLRPQVRPQIALSPETLTPVEFSRTRTLAAGAEPKQNLASLTQLPAIVAQNQPTPAVPQVAEPSTNELPASTPAPVPSMQSPAQATPNSSASTAARILSPAPGTVLDVPATTIVLQYPVGSQAILQVNGTTVDPSLIGRTETDSSTNLVTQTWYGVGLEDGQNTITLQTTTNGIAATPVSVDVVVRGAPSELTVSSVETRIPADGRSTVTIQGELLDENGNRSNRDAVITLEASDGEFTGADYNTDQPGFQVQARQGQYTSTLRSSLDAGVVRLRATTGTLEAFYQIEFQTSLHPTLISGVINLRLGARGTDFFGSFRDFLPPDRDNGTQLDARGAVFATTRIGEWQFTGAYNSDRPLNRDCNGEDPLFRETQNCEQTYPVYGDSSTSDIVTPSTDQVYARIERTSPVRGAGSDFLMWGDYSISDEFATQSQLFTATNRSLHGLYGNYNLGNLRISAFYGTNVQGFQRDTIAPDGTSGYYFLSRRLLVSGSENVFIETEEFNRPGTVLESQRLTRGADYQIDYDRGTLLFNRPILKTGVDQQGRVLVRRIVTTYEYESNDNANIYGGRAQYNLSRELNRESWIGATYVRENQGNRHFELYGADALISFGEDGQLIAEYAHSENTSDSLGAVDGSAYRIEAQATVLEGVRARAYYRSTTAGFANNATTSFVPGQTRYGAELAAALSPSTSLRASYDHEDNVGVAPRVLDDLFDLLNPGSQPAPGSRVDNSLTTLTLGIDQQIGEATLGLDWIHRDRQDRMNSSATETSDQVRSRLTVPITRNVTLRAQNELNLFGNDSLYPSRTILGVDWQVYPGITVSLNHQFFSTKDSGENSITSLNLDGDYHFGSDTKITGHFSMMGGHGLAGSLGLQQGWTIAPGLRANFTYEHIFANEFNTTAAGAQFAQPYAVGQGASALGLFSGDSYSAEIAYTDNPNFQANARFEHRTSSEGSNTVISASALGRITPDLTALVNYQQASSSNQLLSNLGTTSTLRVGLAYRDLDNDRFNALLRYEHRRNPSTIPDDLLSSSGTGSEEDLFAAEAIFAPDWRWEFYGKFGLRHSTSYLASDLVGSSTVTLAQLRATYRLGYRWDVAAEARWISQPSANYTETGFSLEAGYYLTPNMRLAAGYSAGAVSDRDFNGSRSAGGLYLGITLKLDNNLFRDFGFGDNDRPRQQDNDQPIATDSPEPTAFEPTASEPTASASTVTPAPSELRNQP